MSEPVLIAAWDVVKAWGPQGLFGLIVYGFLAQRIGSLEKSMEKSFGEVQKTMQNVCSDQSILHGRATKNEADIAYIKGKINGNHDLAK